MFAYLNPFHWGALFLKMKNLADHLGNDRREHIADLKSVEASIPLKKDICSFEKRMESPVSYECSLRFGVANGIGVRRLESCLHRVVFFILHRCPSEMLAAPVSVDCVNVQY